MNDIPKDLLKILPYVQRGKEMSTADSVIAYYCIHYAVKVGLGLNQGNLSEEANQYISSLLDTLEKLKEELNEKEEVKNEQAGFEYLRKFALMIFTKTDNEDRLQTPTAVTARNFIISTHFMEVLADFKPLESDIKEKIKYAKYRAAGIMRAIREGRDPTLSIQTEAQPRVQTSTAEDQRETHSTLDATKHSFDQSSSTADKNKGSSDIGDISDILNFASPKATKSKKSDTSTPQEIKSFDEFKYPSFNHNDDLMSKPTISRPVPPLSPPSSGMMMSRGLEDTKNDYSQTLVTKTKGTATAAATPLISTSNSPTIAFSEVQPPVLDLSASKSAAKHARWAISALDYDDVETAIKNLELAINTLLPYRKR